MDDNGFQLGADILPTESTKLGQWYATAICGNDITSSCLYVSALALLWAGPLAPISLIMVAGVLWLFRKIYSEVIEALPLNGGAYNALLNTTSKFRASLAACLTILSYLATAVISASEAIHYGMESVSYITGAPKNHGLVLFFTAILLALFALLTIKGIGESAKVALAIFIFHISSLFILIFCAIGWISQNGTDVFLANLVDSPPLSSSAPLLFGFAVAMLGISGFESSANFVEEQKPGVFPKTLRNMWVAVSFFNPMICILALAVIPLPEVQQHREALLAHMGTVSSGSWLGFLISLDASLVLSGAVLTSFIGVTGLVHRMTLDRCLPQLFLKKSMFKTFHRIIVAFFLCAVALVYVAGDLSNLAGVYTISFLLVMGLFAYGNILLKIKRSTLRRKTKASWLSLIIALIAVTIGIVVNIRIEVKYVEIFLLYFIPTILIVIVMLNRTGILRAGISFVHSFNIWVGSRSQKITLKMEAKLDEINSQVMVFFTRGRSVENLNQAVLYVKNNEHTNHIKIVTVVKDKNEVTDDFFEEIRFLDKVYPSVQIEFVVEEGKFGPSLLHELSIKWNIPLNFMFIGSPQNSFPHRLSELGGVRLII